MTKHQNAELNYDEVVSVPVDSTQEEKKRYLLVHLLADAQQHQHVVALRDAHGVKVTEDVAARYPPLTNRKQHISRPSLNLKIQTTVVFTAS